MKTTLVICGAIGLIYMVSPFIGGTLATLYFMGDTFIDGLMKHDRM